MPVRTEVVKQEVNHFIQLSLSVHFVKQLCWASALEFGHPKLSNIPECNCDKLKKIFCIVKVIAMDIQSTELEVLALWEKEVCAPDPENPLQDVLCPMLFTKNWDYPAKEVFVPIFQIPHKSIACLVCIYKHKCSVPFTSA